MTKPISMHQSLPRPTQVSYKKDDPYLEVAKGMEKEFLQLMISKMQDTVEKTDPQSTELDYYNSLLESEYATQMSNQNEGKGLQELILKQIDPRYKMGKDKIL